MVPRLHLSRAPTPPSQASTGHMGTHCLHRLISVQVSISFARKWLPSGRRSYVSGTIFVMKIGCPLLAPHRCPMYCPSPISTPLLNITGVGRMAPPRFLVNPAGAVGVEELVLERAEDGSESQSMQIMVLWQHQRRRLVVGISVVVDRQLVSRPTSIELGRRWHRHHNQVHR